MQMLKRALIAYVNSIKAVWSKLAHPLDIVSRRKGNVKDYRIYGNSVQDGTPTPENPIEVQSVGELTAKNIFNIDEGLNECLVKNEDGTYTLRRKANNRFAGYITLNIPANTKIALGNDVIEYKRSTTQSIGKSTVGLQVFFSDGTEGTINFYKNTTGTSTSSYHVTSTTKDIVKARLYMPPDDVAGDYITFKNMQIEIGTERTEYEPYQKYKVPIEVRGKNLIDKNALRISKDYCESYEMNGNIIMAKGNAPNEKFASSGGYIKFAIPNNKNLPSGEYTFSVNITLLEAGDFGADLRLYSGSVSKPTEKYTDWKNITLNKELRINCSGKYTNGFNSATIRINGCKILIDVGSLQIEKGTTATEYEPYIEPQTVDIYLDEPLRKVGDYADCVDFGKGVVVRNVGKRYLKDYKKTAWDLSTPLDSLEHYIFSAVDNSIHPNNSDAKLTNSERLAISKGFSNLFGLVDTHDTNSFDMADKIPLHEWGRNVRVCITKTRLTDASVDAFVSWLNENNPYMIRILVTPTEQPIMFPKLPQFKGTTIYEVQTAVLPGGIEVCYYE